MTPEEKARSLISMFQLYAEIHGGNQEGARYDATVMTKNAKQCALIAVDEIIEVLKSGDGPPGSTYSNPGKFYWQQVKQEMQKV
jgi:hypothetical protein